MYSVMLLYYIQFYVLLFIIKNKMHCFRYVVTLSNLTELG